MLLAFVAHCIVGLKATCLRGNNVRGLIMLYLLGRLYMLVYLKGLFSALSYSSFNVNDFTNMSDASINLFADDTSSYITDADPSRLSTRLCDAVNLL